MKDDLVKAGQDIEGLKAQRETLDAKLTEKANAIAALRNGGEATAQVQPRRGGDAGRGR